MQKFFKKANGKNSSRITNQKHSNFSKKKIMKKQAQYNVEAWRIGLKRRR